MVSPNDQAMSTTANPRREPRFLNPALPLQMMLGDEVKTVHWKK